MNREAYEANKTQVRQDMADFEDKVFEEQDKLYTESVVILKKSKQKQLKIRLKI